MDLITELNLAIEYIEENLTDEVALGEVSKITTYSPYHFQRIFNYITGIPLSEYIRRRKLSLAVIDLQREEKVIDVAMKYGYNSADSFTRAFAKNHKGEEIIVGSVLVEMEEGYIPEIVGVMVLPEYRRRYMAAVMLEYVLEVLNKMGKDKVWLVTPSNNHTAIAMYKKLGFSIDSHEQRYMKYI